MVKTASFTLGEIPSVPEKGRIKSRQERVTGFLSMVPAPVFGFSRTEARTVLDDIRPTRSSRSRAQFTVTVTAVVALIAPLEPVTVTV
jgi:hypothetical protein